jgi:cytidylate kinase
MAKKQISVKQFVTQQVKKWKSLYSEDERTMEAWLPVITIASQPGSGGTAVGQEICKRMGFDFFHHDIVEQIARSAKIRSTVINTLEKERLSGVKDFISSLMEDQYVHPGTYLRHLIHVINTIAEHGRAVIVGRGANFILPPENIFAVRIIAPLEARVRNVALAYKVPVEEAKQRISGRESSRKAFVRRSFNADIADPNHYDMTVNTGKIGIEAAVEAIIGAVMRALIGKSAATAWR